MTGKKFTDEEIIEALDLCTQQNGSIPCYDCPCWNNDEQECEGIDYTATLDLINRQKAEIGRLKECPKCVYEYDGEMTEYCIQGPCPNFKPVYVSADLTIKQIKAEAYKEFAERMRECCTFNDDLSADDWLSVTADIDRVLKSLEKQIPKKPINVEKHYYECPCCKHDLGVSDDDIFVYENYRPMYCSNCGQALDWSDTE